MSRTATVPEERYQALLEALLDRPGVTASERGGGGSGLWVRGRVFAALVRGRLLVKLPRQRVDTLVAAGAGQRFDSGHGRLMTEWLTVPASSREAWLPLAEEALAFVTAGA